MRQNNIFDIVDIIVNREIMEREFIFFNVDNIFIDLYSLINLFSILLNHQPYIEHERDRIPESSLELLESPQDAAKFSFYREQQKKLIKKSYYPIYYYFLQENGIKHFYKPKLIYTHIEIQIIINREILSSGIFKINLIDQQNGIVFIPNPGNLNRFKICKILIYNNDNILDTIEFIF